MFCNIYSRQKLNDNFVLRYPKASNFWLYFSIVKIGTVD